jgi:hypothetical protein
MLLVIPIQPQQQPGTGTTRILWPQFWPQKRWLSVDFRGFGWNEKRGRSP